MNIEQIIEFTKIGQSNINLCIAKNVNKAAADIAPFIGKVVEIETNNKIIKGVISDENPIDIIGSTIRLILKNYRSDYKVEKRKRVVPIETIKNIKIIGNFKKSC